MFQRRVWVRERDRAGLVCVLISSGAVTRYHRLGGFENRNVFVLEAEPDQSASMAAC